MKIYLRFYGRTLRLLNYQENGHNDYFSLEMVPGNCFSFADETYSTLLLIPNDNSIFAQHIQHIEQKKAGEKISKLLSVGTSVENLKFKPKIFY